MTTRQLFLLSLLPIQQRVLSWFYGMLHQHYAVCAEVEREKAKDAHANAAYYDRKAVIARSNQLTGR